MSAITKFLAGGVAIAAIAAAAPAAAQDYPGYGYPGLGYGVPGSGYGVPGYGVPGYGYGYNQYGYGVNRQFIVNQCASAVQARLGGGYGGYGYDNQYGYGAGGGRVLGISRVEPRGDGGYVVRGVATSGRYRAYGYGQNRPDLVWKCRTDFRGAIVDVDVNAAERSYGYQYTPWDNDYSQYGYSRY